jgi:hypothetical protein
MGRPLPAARVGSTAASVAPSRSFADEQPKNAIKTMSSTEGKPTCHLLPHRLIRWVTVDERVC